MFFWLLLVRAFAIRMLHCVIFPFLLLPFNHLAFWSLRTLLIYYFLFSTALTSFLDFRFGTTSVTKCLTAKKKRTEGAEKEKTRGNKIKQILKLTSLLHETASFFLLLLCVQFVVVTFLQTVAFLSCC